MTEKKVLILCAHRRNRSPSQRFRFEQYLPYLQENGFSFTYSNLLNQSDDLLFYAPGNFFAKVLILIRGIFMRVKDCRRFRKFDIIFIQREAMFLGSSLFEKCAYRSGRMVIFDFDDSIWLADTSPGNKKWEWIKRPEKFFSNLRYAHVVVAGNRYLAGVAAKYNHSTVIIPTTIDTDHHVPKPELRNSSAVVIGWSGSISTIKHVNELLGVFDQVKAKYGKKVRFKIIADKLYSGTAIDIESVPWHPDSEVDELNTFDIGIMPLPDDAWAMGKCGLKGLSYMACGVATIMSAVGTNNEIVSHGYNGMLVCSHAEWLEALCLLIENKTLRDQLGAAGRETVVQHYSVTAQRSKYLEVFRFA